MKKSSPIIIDSSVIYSIASSDDSNHQKAQEISNRLFKDKRTIIMPEDVFSETLNIIGKKLGREKQFDVAKDLLSGIFLIIESNEKIRSCAAEKLKKIAGSVSYTDCAVMAFADEYQTKEILGFDEVFGKQGYKLPE